MATMIPAFLCIDAEPNERSPEMGPRAWTGFTSLVDFMEDLRAPLAEQSGVAPRPTWFFRMDPVIEECFGRPDFAVHNHRAAVDTLLAHGDPVAIHVHAHRWDHEAGHTYSDHTDDEWARYCVKYSADVFERTFGEPVQRASLGSRFAPEPMVSALVEAGVRVDLTVEPGMEPVYVDSTFGTRATGPSTDFRGYPRHPYRVSQRSVAVPATSADDARPLVEIPRTSYDFVRAQSRLRRRVKMRVLGLGKPMPMNVYDVWPSAKTFWDLIWQAAEESPLPYVAIAVRSDPETRGSNQIARELLMALPQHPLAQRLAFVDPLAFADLPPGVPSRGSAPRTHWASVTAAEARSNSG